MRQPSPQSASRSASAARQGRLRDGTTLCLGLTLALATACGDDAVDAESDGGGSTGEASPPSMPVLLSPPDGSRDLAPSVELCWSPSWTRPGADMRYRVLLDGEPVDADGAEVYETTCRSVPKLAYDQSYAWSVEAVDIAAPETDPVTSETWTFTTGWDPAGKILFEDDFSTDLGWAVFGDATSGRWARGTPPHVDAGGPSAPQTCHGDGPCWFTHGSVDGTTVLLSPPFDVTGADRIHVELARVFHRTSFERSSASFAIDLLVPDDEAPLHYRQYALERLVNAEDAQAAATWTEVSLSACAILFEPGTRLRITASDHGNETVEAAIDQVVVKGYKGTSGCPTGIGTLCDPAMQGGCDEGLLCCNQGVVDVGYYRCSEPSRGLDLANPPPSPGAPANGELGCHAPDIVLLDEVADLPMRVFVDELYVPPDACSLAEMCVDGPGWRRLLRFDTITANIGSRDLTMGAPDAHPDLFMFSDCHAHYHFDDYARYALLDTNGLAVAGHKQAFCLMDLVSWAWPQSGQSRYDCFDQGISMGWADVYDAALDCQWIDITGLDPGDYTLHIEVNYPRHKAGTPTLIERDYDNNTLEVPVTIP